MERIIELNGVYINYWDQGTGPALVFLHGLGGSINQAKEITEGLTGYRIISMDFRGHGNSKRYIAESDAQMKVFEEDIQSLITHLGLTEYILGGISLGSAISIRHALAHPERVRKLILIRPAWIDERDPVHFAPLKLAHDLIQKYGLSTGFEYFQESSLYQKLKESNPGYADSLLGQFSRPQADTSYALLKHLPEDRPFESCSLLNQINIPVLVIGSDNDPLHPYSYAQIYHRHLPSSRLEKVYSKYLNAETHNQAVRKLIKEFLSD